MCVVALAYDHHPKWLLVLAANRDEFHARAAVPMARWGYEDSHIIAGRDLQSGGTWLGVSEQGRLAVITNIRTGIAPDPDKASRGALVTDYLRGYRQADLTEMDRFNPFSLLTIGPEGPTLIANRPVAFIESLKSGIHGLSNGEPRESWPRKERLLTAFADYLRESDALTDNLFTLLASESIDDSIFIRNELYGTRCSTIVLIGREGTGQIIERRFDTLGYDAGRTILEFAFL